MWPGGRGQVLDPVQAAPIASAVEDGTMAVSEALSFVSQFVSADQGMEQYESPSDDDDPDDTEEQHDYLIAMLEKLDPIQAAPIHDAVLAGTMDVYDVDAPISPLHACVASLCEGLVSFAIARVRITVLFAVHQCCGAV